MRVRASGVRVVGLLSAWVLGVVLGAGTCDDSCPGMWRVLSPSVQGTVSCVTSAPDGRIFVGLAAGGLREYHPDADGEYVWRSYTVANSDLASNAVTDVGVFYNELWIGTSGAGISILNLDDGTWGLVNVANSLLPSDMIRHITVVPPASDDTDPARTDWSVWVSTPAGAAHYRAVKLPQGPYLWAWTVVDGADGLPSSDVRDIGVQTLSGTTYVWIAAGSYLGRWNGTDYLPYTGNCGLTTANRVLVDTRNAVWFNMLREVPTKSDYIQQGLCRGTRNLFNQWSWSSFDDRYGRDMSADAYGRVWFGSSGQASESGAWVWDRSHWCIFKSATTPLYSDNVSAVEALGEATWFGHGNSPRVSVYSPNWDEYTLTDLHGGGFPAVTLLAGGAAFVGTGGGVSWQLDPDGAWVNSTIGGNAFAVSALLRDGNTLYAGTAGNGIFALNLTTQAFSPAVTAADGLPSNDVRALAMDADDHLWAATSGGLGVRGNGYWMALTSTTSPLPSNDLRALAVDAEGRLWIGTRANGIAVLDTKATGDAAWSFHTAAGGQLASERVNGLARVGSDIWAATEGGASQWVNATHVWVLHDVASGAMPSDIVRCVTPDVGRGRGRVWIGTQAGLARYENETWAHYHVPGSSLRSDVIWSLDADWERLLVCAGGSVAERRNLRLPLGNLEPTITSFTPASGAPGTLVTITGTGFDDRGPEYNGVSVGLLEAGASTPSPAAEVVSVTATKIVFTVPLRATSGKIKVVAHCMDADSAASFDVTPRIDSISPTAIGLGSMLEIRGAGFSGFGAADVKIGNGPWRTPAMSPWDSQKPELLRVRITPEDTAGVVRVRGGTGEVVVTSTQSLTIGTLAVSGVRIQQAVQGMQLIWGKRTLVHVALAAGGADGHVDRGVLKWRLIGGATLQGGIAYATGPGGTAALLNEETSWDDLSLGVDFIAEFYSNRSAQSELFPLMMFNGVELELFNNDVSVLTHVIPASSFGYYDMGTPLRMEAVAVFNSVNPTGWISFWDTACRGFDHVARIYPQQDVRWFGAWITYNPAVFMVRDRVFIAGDGEPGDDSTDDLTMYGADDLLDAPFGTVGLAMIDETLYLGGPTGVALTGSMWYEDLVYPTTALVFNLPAITGSTAAHEAGHVLGLVDDSMPNIDPANGHHSRYDEGNPHDPNGTWPSCDDAADLTYTQAMIDQLGSARRVYGLDGGPPRRLSLSACSDPRAKALMSYAPGMNNDNALFEPLEYRTISTLLDFIGYVNEKAARKGPDDSPTLCMRGSLSGGGALSVTLSYVADDETPRTPAAPWGEYVLVLQDVGGAALLEHPFAVVTQSSAGVRGSGRFRLAVEFPEGTARAEIRRGNDVRWSRTVSKHPPQVSFTSPTGGTYSAADPMRVAWSASDVDGGALQFALDYTPDDGRTWQRLPQYLTAKSYDWTPAFAAESGAGRLRVRASDGFLTATALSAPFVLRPVAPVVLIRHPDEGQEFCEGSEVDLVSFVVSGGDADARTYQWSVNGRAIRGATTAEWRQTFATAGEQFIEVDVREGKLSASASVTIVVVPDFDRDGIPNAWELQHRLNPFDAKDPHYDPDGDGLTNKAEFLIGADPRDNDSDNDGAPDGEEFAKGTSPLSGASLPAVGPVLHLGASTLGFIVQEGDAESAPRTLWVTNPGSGNLMWTAQADVPWLRVAPAGGAAPGEITLTALPGVRGIGTYTGHVTVFAAGAAGSPAAATVTMYVVAHVDQTADEGFIRGDSNADFTLNIADPISTLSFLFAHAAAPMCQDAADANDDGKVDIADPIRTLYHLFASGGPLPQPFPGCGRDPTADVLPCTPKPCTRR